MDSGGPSELRIRLEPVSPRGRGTLGVVACKQQNLLRRKLLFSNLHTPKVIRLASVINWYLVDGNQWMFHFRYTDENDLFNFAEISYAVK